MGAIQAAAGRAEGATSRMAARATELQARLQQVQDLQARVGDIAAAVREVTEFAREAKDPRLILERLAPVEARIDTELQEARAQECEDLAHEIAGLREMITTVRRKLGGA
jgi:ABC-type phosphate transport system auxiliary subunit